jgi:hypothetical protein
MAKEDEETRERTEMLLKPTTSLGTEDLALNVEKKDTLPGTAGPPGLIQ